MRPAESLTLADIPKAIRSCIFRIAEPHSWATLCSFARIHPSTGNRLPHGDIKTMIAYLEKLADVRLDEANATSPIPAEYKNWGFAHVYSFANLFHILRLQLAAGKPHQREHPGN